MQMQLPTPKSAARERAIATDALATEHVPLCSVWHDLAGRSSRVVDAFFTERRCYALLSTAPRFGDPPLDARQLRILDTVLCGQGQKTAAIELGLAPSTIALTARMALHTVGISGKPSRVHPLFMFAAISARLRLDWKRARASSMSDGADVCRVISMSRPELPLAQEFPPAELIVLTALVEGRSYDDIARLRGTSVRTIANQAAAVFRRLGVSGRSQLMSKLLMLSEESEPCEVVTLMPAADNMGDPRSGSMALYASG